MFKLRSVVFIVFIITICSVFGKNHKLRAQISSKNRQFAGATGLEVKNELTTSSYILNNDHKTERDITTDNPVTITGDFTSDSNISSSTPITNNNASYENSQNTNFNDSSNNSFEVNGDGFDIHSDQNPQEIILGGKNSTRYEELLEYVESLVHESNLEDAINDPFNNFTNFVKVEFYLADLDGDSKLTYQEYIERLGRLAEFYGIPYKVLIDYETDHYYLNFDTNHDESLDEAEFFELVKQTVKNLDDLLRENKGKALEEEINNQGKIEETDTIQETDFYSIAQYIKNSLKMKDAREFVDEYILGENADCRLRWEILADFEGENRILDYYEFNSLVKNAIEKIKNYYERQQLELETEVIKDNSTQGEGFLKLKSTKKTRSLKNKAKILKKSKKSKKNKLE